MMRFILIFFVFFVSSCGAQDSLKGNRDIKAIKSCLAELNSTGSALFNKESGLIDEAFQSVRVTHYSLSDYVGLHFGIASKEYESSLISDYPPVLCWVDMRGPIIKVKFLSAPENHDGHKVVQYLMFTDEEMELRKKKIEDGLSSGLEDVSDENIYRIVDGDWVMEK